MSYRIGVDLGTTFTAAAVANGMPPTMVGLGNRALQIPSVVFVAEDGSMVFGEAAERRGQAQPDRVVREFKRRIGDTVPILVAGTPYSPQSLAARLLAHVLATAGERMSGPPEEVVLTHPANWGPFKLELLDQVARLAGVERWVRCPEPLAAATQYAAQTRVAVGDTIAVYDLGGGTFDACVLEKTATGFALLGVPEGIEHLGGIDFDEALFQHVLGLLGNRLAGLDPNDPDAMVGLTRLRRDCVDAKEALSTDTEALLPVALPGLSTTLRLTRSEFEGLIRPALGDTIGALERAVHSAGRTPQDLRAIVLVGGSSRIPLIGELLHQRFPTTPTAMDAHPKHDIALGAVQTDRGVPAPAGIPAPAGVPRAAGDATVPTMPAERPPDRAAVRTRGPIRRRWVVVVAAGTAAALAGIGVGFAVVASAGRSGAGPTAQASMPFDTSAPHTPSVTSVSSTPTPTGSRPATPASLPRSAPLGPTQMLVQMQTNGHDDVWVGDTRSPAPLRRLSTGRGSSWGMDISPAQDSMIYIHTDDNGKNSSLRVAGVQRLEGDRELFPRPSGCLEFNRPAWNPVDPTRLAVPCIDPNGRYVIYVMTIDGTMISHIAPPAGLPRLNDVVYSADGSRLAFWAAPDADKKLDGGVLYTVPVDGGTPQPLLKEGKPTVKGSDADPAFSPDGKYVAFRRRVPVPGGQAQSDVYRVKVDGTGLTQLTDDPASEQNPAWSPDSGQIAYKSGAATADGPSPFLKIWTMTVDGKDQKPLWTKGSFGPQALAAWTAR
ncbi:MAG TPA: Hsp70 family protein [Microlunatus sp.]|nr:Hsp70 family protein [Microlunatus sp.]